MTEEQFQTGLKKADQRDLDIPIPVVWDYRGLTIKRERGLFKVSEINDVFLDRKTAQDGIDDWWKRWDRENN